MKTQTLTVRLPEEQLELMQKMAEARGLKLSELGRGLILAGLEQAKSGSEASKEVIAKLQQVETNLLGAHSWLADALLTNLRATVGARFLAQAGADNTDEVISYLANNKPLDAKTKAQWQKNRLEAEGKQADQLIAQVMNIPPAEENPY